MNVKAAGAALAAVIFLATPAIVTPAAGQDSPFPSSDGLQASRQDLTDLLLELEQAASSGDRDTREQAEARAARVRQRLAHGDFQAGDRITLEVRGDARLTGDYVVDPGPTIVLPDIGDVSLAGVLRSELQDHLRQELSRYLHSPSVRARSMIRLGIIGEVGSPGFFAIPASAILEDAVMTAGGPTRQADLNKIRIERSGQTVWKDRPLQEAMLEARTLDQLNLQAGDRIVVPSRGTRILSWTGITTIIGTVGTLAYLYTRIF
jgi:hypothetical protein